MAAPSMRERLGRGPEPTEVLRALRGEPHPVALVGSWAAAAAVVGAAPIRVASGTRAVWAALEEPHVVPPGDARVGGGWIGTLGYGLAASVERLDPPPPRPVPGPSGWLGYYDHLLLLDRDGVWWFEALPADAARATALRDRCEALHAALTTSAHSLTVSKGTFALPGQHECAFRQAGGGVGARLVGAAPRAPGYAGHRAAVAAAVEAIGAGEVFQANLCLRVEARLEGEAIDLFARTAAATAPAFGAYVDTGARQLVSLSPERFLRRERATVVASPIKGTAPRDGDPAALRASAKDRAEHVMILDLMRNDLGRVCEFGTVTADAEPRIEPHPGVWHLVSDVRGTLRPGITDTDVLRATFPPGSVTGAPKVQALHVIGRLEATGREAYTGAIGLVSPVAGLELNVAIRTFEIAGDRAWLGVGGGIVADSDPDAETLEAWRKAAPLLEAAGSPLARPPTLGTDAPDDARAGSPGSRLASRAPVGAATRGGPSPTGYGAPALRPPARGARRPDPALGVFETVGLDADGNPRRLDAHVARLAASVRDLYGVELDRAAVLAAVDAALGARTSRPGRDDARLAPSPSAPTATPETPASAPTPTPEAPDRAVPDRRPAAPRRLRILISPAGEIRAELAPGAARTAPVELVPLVVCGGLGAHKWQDRAALPGPGTPLIVDLDGSVLEAGWASVWLLEGDTLVTPPADGRLLPGVTRAALLAHPDVDAREEPVGLARLAAADAVLLTSAVTLAVAARYRPPADGPASDTDDRPEPPHRDPITNTDDRPDPPHRDPITDTDDRPDPPHRDPITDTDDRPDPPHRDSTAEADGRPRRRRDTSGDRAEAVAARVRALLSDPCD